MGDRPNSLAWRRPVSVLRNDNPTAYPSSASLSVSSLDPSVYALGDTCQTRSIESDCSHATRWSTGDYRPLRLVRAVCPAAGTIHQCNRPLIPRPSLGPRPDIRCGRPSRVPPQQPAPGAPAAASPCDTLDAAECCPPVPRRQRAVRFCLSRMPTAVVAPPTLSWRSRAWMW